MSIHMKKRRTLKLEELDHLAYYNMKFFIPCCSLLLFFISNLVSTTSTSFLTNNNITTASGFTLELIHIDHPSSPFYNSTMTQEERYQRLHEISDKNMQLHHESTAMHPNSFEVSQMIFLVGSPSLYWVQLGIGTPRTTNKFKLSTGTDVISTKCQPSKIKYTDMYDPEQSSTSTPVSCNDRLCKQPNFHCLDGKHCAYKASFYYGTLTGGPLIRDNIYSPSSEFHPKRKASQLNCIAIACVQNTMGLFFSPHTAGTLGLGYGAMNLPSQIPSGSFSYCLSSNTKTRSLLRFWNEIKTENGVMTKIRLIKHQHSNSYYLNLVAIGLNNVLLNIPLHTFDFREDTATGGCVIDTGITFTHLVREADDVVAREIKSYFQKRPSLYGNVEETSKMMGFNHCYTLKRRRLFFWNLMKGLPSMTLYLGSDKFEIPPNNLFVFDPVNQILCLALKPSESMTVIGNYQQRNVRFIYTHRLDILQFGPEDCSRD